MAAIKHLFVQRQYAPKIHPRHDLIHHEKQADRDRVFLCKSRLRLGRLGRLGRRHAAEPVITQVDPRGQTMYWIGNAGPAMDDSEGTDFHAAELGHVVVTPLKVDLTDHANLERWADTLNRSASMGKP